MTLILEKLNWKTIIISALSAVFISILSGLAGGVGISSILFRAFIVLIVFVLFSGLVNFIVMTFLSSDTIVSNTVQNVSQEEGSKVNIVLTEDDDAISELQSDDSVPVNENTSSVDIGSETRNSESSGDKSEKSDLSESVDIDSLPDLGSFSTTFSSAVDNEEKKTDSEVETGYNESNSFSSGSKFSAEGLAGTIGAQNTPEDLAKAVKTVLKRGD